MPPPHKPAIVIYGAGQYGCYLTRLAVQKGWRVVAAFNRAGEKIGRDLGRVAGLDRDLGVTVQDCDTASYDGLRADIAIVAQTNLLSLNIIAYRRLLNAGLNVLCHGGESYYPHGNDPSLAEEIDGLAKKNGVTFTGGGIWDMSRIWSGILLAGPCTELRSLFHSSITDLQGQAAVKEHATQVGAGDTVTQFFERGLHESKIARAYKTIPEHVLVALGYTIAETRVRVEPVVLDGPLESVLLERTIRAGDCAGTRIIGDIETIEGVSARTEVELRLFRPGEVEHMFWSVDGLPRGRVRVERSDSAHATAASLFNRIRDVIHAPPGIRLVSQLGPLRHSALD